MTGLTIGKVIALPTRDAAAAPSNEPVRRVGVGRVVGREVINAAEHANQLLANAQAACASRLATFERDVDRLRNELREELAAELAVEHTNKLLELATLRNRAVLQAQDDIVQLARLLAERVLHEELTTHPERVIELGRELLRETAGAKRITLYASHQAAEVLRNELGLLAPATGEVSIEIVADAELGPGDLRVQTDLGSIDARIGTQLANLASTLVESIRS